jgi:hypothetical protein
MVKLFQKQRSKTKPRRLRTRKRRALTYDENRSDKQFFEMKTTVSDLADSACTLLTRLPAAIRRKIWEQVIGGYTIALFHGNRRLLHAL